MAWPICNSSSWCCGAGCGLGSEGPACRLAVWWCAVVRLCHAMRLVERCSAMALALCLMGLVLSHLAQTGGEWQDSLVFLQLWLMVLCVSYGWQGASACVWPWANVVWLR